MGLLLTFYIYPIREKITLSHRLGYHLDNPRTDEEVLAVKGLLVDVHSKYEPVVPIQSEEPIITIANTLEQFYTVFAQEDEYVKSFFDQFKEGDIFELVARMWIVIRFDENTERQVFPADIEGFTQDSEVMFKLREEGEIQVGIPDDLIKYGHLISLLIREEEKIHNIESFIINPASPKGEERVQKLWFNFACFGQNCFEYSNYGDEAWYDWHFFPYRQRCKYTIFRNPYLHPFYRII